MEFKNSCFQNSTYTQNELMQQFFNLSFFRLRRSPRSLRRPKTWRLRRHPLLPPRARPPKPPLRVRLLLRVRPPLLRERKPLPRPLPRKPPRVRRAQERTHQPRLRPKHLQHLKRQQRNKLAIPKFPPELPFPLPPCVYRYYHTFNFPH